MDRRLIVLVGLALAVVGPGPRLAPAAAEGEELPAPAPAPAPAPTDAELPAAKEPGAEPPAMPPPAAETMPAVPAPTPAEPGPQPPAGPAPAPPAESLPPVAAQPPPSEPPAPMPAPAPALPDAPRDLQLERSQVPVLGARPGSSSPSPRKGGPGPGSGPDRGPLPPASEATGPAGAAAPPDSADHVADPFVLPPDRLPVGRQAVGLTVDVMAPPVLNLNQVATLKVVVKNTGTSDAMGVVVRDELPASLTYLSSQPEAERNESLLFWKLNTVPAGSERTILVRVKPVAVGPFEHAATVTMLAGVKSRTVVRAPKLKVDQTATPGKVLKGQQVRFQIVISNPGDGPARNVVVQAKLSPGLRHESGEPNDQNLFELQPFDLESNQRLVLDPLVADTILAGEQSCLVTAQSPDVTTGGDDARSLANVNVVEPRLKMTIAGDEKRYTDTIATYHITLENPGTATAHNVRVLANVPLSGRLVTPPPSGARWESSTGKLLWTIPQLEPGEKEKVTLTFQVRMGNVGDYHMTALAKADGGLSANANCVTMVSGLALFEFQVVEKRHVVDIGDTTAFQVRIKNIGTKEATNLLVKAYLSRNVKPLETSNSLDNRTQAQYNPDQQPLPLLVFPPIERLAPNHEVVLGIKVQALEKSLGTCRVYLVHDDLDQNEALEDMASFRITAPHP